MDKNLFLTTTAWTGLFLAVFCAFSLTGPTPAVLPLIFGIVAGVAMLGISVFKARENPKILFTLGWMLGFFFAFVFWLAIWGYMFFQAF